MEDTVIDQKPDTDHPTERPASATECFSREQSRLRSIAYRMLGSAAEADDIVQDTWMRFEALDFAALERPAAMLTTITTRLCLDRMKSSQATRETYPGTWLPEPVLTGEPCLTPAETVLRAESITFAFLVVLETLSPLERAVFLLRAVFDHDFEHIASTLERSEASCRQLFHRAQEHVERARPRFVPDKERKEQLLRHFLFACASGDLSTLESMLAADVVVYSDGGGKVTAARNPVVGANNVARMMIGLTRKTEAGIQLEFVYANASPAVVLRRSDGTAHTILSLDVYDGKIQTVWAVRHPEKLRLAGSWQ